MLGQQESFKLGARSYQTYPEVLDLCWKKVLISWTERGVAVQLDLLPWNLRGQKSID